MGGAVGSDVPMEVCGTKLGVQTHRANKRDHVGPDCLSSLPEGAKLAVDKSTPTLVPTKRGEESTRGPTGQRGRAADVEGGGTLHPRGSGDPIKASLQPQTSQRRNGCLVVLPAPVTMKVLLLVSPATLPRLSPFPGVFPHHNGVVTLQKRWTSS